MPADARAEQARILAILQAFGTLLAFKLYRLRGDASLAIPTLPCLDHEAMLHGGIAGHLAAYVAEADSGDLHEVVVYPTLRRIEIDTASTWGEHSPESHARLKALLRGRLPEYHLSVHGPTWWRGERRVAEAVRAQVSLREVLLGDDVKEVDARIRRLQTISSLMEKQSRVASWGVRTVTGPLLAAAGVVTLLSVEPLTNLIGPGMLVVLRYGIVGILGAVFLYYGLKAVQLTEMANRVWKRATEYALIMAERQRLALKATKGEQRAGGSSRSS